MGAILPLLLGRLLLWTAVLVFLLEEGPSPLWAGAAPWLAGAVVGTQLLAVGLRWVLRPEEGRRLHLLLDLLLAGAVNLFYLPLTDRFLPLFWIGLVEADLTLGFLPTLGLGWALGLLSLSWQLRWTPLPPPADLVYPLTFPFLPLFLSLPRALRNGIRTLRILRPTPKAPETPSTRPSPLEGLEPAPLPRRPLA